MNKTPQFDAYAKERDLQSESKSWDTTRSEDAATEDIPVIDLQEYLSGGKRQALDRVAAELRLACEQVGFFTITGHQVDPGKIRDMFALVKAFHQLPDSSKQAILMDRPDWPVGGVGYLPLKNRKLPARDKANLNEAFIVKCDHQLSMEDNQWPDASLLPGFRVAVEAYADAMVTLGKQLLPIFATALEMPADFFTKAFEQPQYRLRMTHYPPLATATDDFGIAPHVDTTFCTILAQDRPGLVIFSERRQQWIKAPLLEGAFIVNSGELLKQWSNDRFISVKHFANNNTGRQSRYSIPLFLNANSNYKMSCIPSCCSESNPAKYPPISYAESQAVAQGE